jgi:hypothetical protein
LPDLRTLESGLVTRSKMLESDMFNISINIINIFIFIIINIMNIIINKFEEKHYYF